MGESEALRSHSLNGTGIGTTKEALQPEAIPWRYASSGETRRGGTPESVAFAEWVSAMAEWTWFVTLTLADRIVTGGFTKPGYGIARNALRELVNKTGATDFVAVFEMQKERGVPHVHALLKTPDAIIGSVAADHFDRAYGFSRWKVYKEGGGAAGYVGKYLAKEVIELYVGLDGPYSVKQLRGTTVGGTRV